MAQRARTSVVPARPGRETGLVVLLPRGSDIQDHAAAAAARALGAAAARDSRRSRSQRLLAGAQRLLRIDPGILLSIQPHQHRRASCVDCLSTAVDGGSVRAGHFVAPVASAQALLLGLVLWQAS